MAEVELGPAHQRISPQNVNSSPPEPTEYPQNIIESRENYLYIYIYSQRIHVWNIYLH